MATTSLNRFGPLRAATVCLAVLAMPTIAYAQNANPVPTTPTAPAGTAGSSIPEVVVTSPPSLDVYQQPPAQSTTTINRDQFQYAPDFSIGEILTESPGVTVKQGNGPRDVGISIRGSNDRNGFGVRNIQVLEDGFPVTQPDGLSRTDLTDPHAYNGFTIYEGPSSVLFGNYATGGAIDFHTRSGASIDGFETEADFGSFNYQNGYGIFGNKGDNYEYMGFASGVRGDGFIGNSKFTTTTENALVTYEPTLNDKFVFKLINNNVDTQLPIRLSLNQFHQNPFQIGCSTAASAALGCATVNLFANGVSGSTVSETASQAGLGRSDQRSIGGVRWERNLDNDTLFRFQFVYDNKNINQPTGATSALGDEPALNFISDLTQHGTAFGLPAVHFFGLYGNYEYLDDFTYNVNTGGNPFAALGAETSRYYGHQSNVGARMQEQISFSPGWTNVAGFAVEDTTLQALDQIYSPSVSQIAADRDFLNWAYEEGVRYQPYDAWIFHARAASGYGTPQASNLFVTPAGVNGDNTQLKSQTNYGFDMGADWRPVDTVHLGLTGFYELFRNELVSQSAGAGLQTYTFNAPRSEHRGVEGIADWRPLPGWRVLSTVNFDDQIYTRYTEQLSAGSVSESFNRSGNHIPGIQPADLFSRVSYDVPDGPLAGLGAYVEYDRRAGFNIDNANLVQVPSADIINLDIHFTPRLSGGTVKSLTVFFDAQNVTNKVYVASANNVTDSINSTTGAQNPASTVASTGGSIYAGEPQAFVGGVRIKF